MIEHSNSTQLSTSTRSSQNATPFTHQANAQHQHLCDPSALTQSSTGVSVKSSATQSVAKRVEPHNYRKYPKCWKSLKAIMVAGLVGLISLTGGHLWITISIISLANGLGTGLIEYFCNYASWQSAIKKAFTSAFIAAITTLVFSPLSECIFIGQRFSESFTLTHILLPQQHTTSYKRWPIIASSVAAIASLIADYAAWTLIPRQINFVGSKPLNDLTIEEIRHMPAPSWSGDGNRLSKGTNRELRCDPKRPWILYKITRKPVNLAEQNKEDASNETLDAGDKRIASIYNHSKYYQGRYQAFANIETAYKKDATSEQTYKITKCLDLCTLAGAQALDVTDTLPASALQEVAKTGHTPIDNCPKNYVKMPRRKFLGLIKTFDYPIIDTKMVGRRRSNSFRTQYVKSQFKNNSFDDDDNSCRAYAVFLDNPQFQFDEKNAL